MSTRANLEVIEGVKSLIYNHSNVNFIFPEEIVNIILIDYGNYYVRYNLQVIIHQIKSRIKEFDYLKHAKLYSGWFYSSFYTYCLSENRGKQRLNSSRIG